MMKIRLVSHASVILESADLRIWTDPWLFGKAFNDSWTLLPPPSFDNSLLEGIDYIWISHEHPDHFHIPTLRSLPSLFKERVIVLFQENNSDKMFNAFRKLGFRRTLALPNRKVLPLSEKTRIYCYQVCNMDSCLGVLSEGQTVLNVNDATINTKDCRLMVRDIGPANVVLNQFSLAGYSGFKDYEVYLPSKAKAILQGASENHRDLKAKATIPFASFIYFSTVDNKYMNKFANTPRDVFEYLKERGQETVVLYPGDVYEVNGFYDSVPVLRRYDALLATLDQIEYDPIKTVPLNEIEAAFGKLVDDLRDRYPRILLRVLKPVVVRIPDLEKTVLFSISSGTFQETSEHEEPDLIVHSQPLHFGFSFPYGVQSLGVSARLVLLRNYRNWMFHRILFSLNNAEMYLRPKYFFTRKNFNYLRMRSLGGMNQLIYKLQRMMT